MRKFLVFFFMICVFASYADAKRYIVTVQNDTRSPINWEAFVTRSGGEVVKTYDFIDGALLDMSEEQAKRLMDRRAPGMTIEEDIREYWLEDSQADNSALGLLKKYASKLGLGMSGSDEKNIVVPAVSDSAEVSAKADGKNDGKKEAEEVPWGISRINAFDVWKRTEGKGIKVAVIDSGVNYNHEDLKANYAGGANFTDEGDSDDPMDGHGHGTHVAGTIAAAKNGIGVVGVAPQARIYSVKVLESSGYGDRSYVISGIEWAVKNKMQVINMSLGSPQMTEAQQKAIQAAHAAGIIIVCSAGNRGPEGPMSYPGRYPETIAVAASSRTDAVASFSSRGKEVDVIAPGVSIYSTTKDGKYGYQSGTSMASPHVAGLAALALAAGYPADQVRNLIQDNAIPLPNLSKDEQGRGLANALWLKKNRK